MKTHTIAFIALLLITAGVLAKEISPDNSLASQEWRAYINSLAPIGERTAKLLSHPEDPLLRQDLYQFLYSQIARGYMGMVNADPRHPDFWPMFNQVFIQGFPNPDNTYYMAAVEDSGVYKISGFRGTIHSADLQVGSGLFFPQGSGGLTPTLANYNLDNLHLDEKDGYFEVILSAQRPPGYSGDWWQLAPSATYVFVRQISLDWLNEVDARLAIDRLDTPAVKPRRSAQQIKANLQHISTWVENWLVVMNGMVNKVRERGVNNIHVINYAASGGLSTQRYAEGIFDLADDEALLIETNVPTCNYWGFQLTDELLSSIDYTNRQSSLNSFTAKLDADGKLRIVVSAIDPGVPNWLDTAGYNRGLVYGRWIDCNSWPAPQTKVIKVADLRKYIPEDTAVVTLEQRDAAIRVRRMGAQLRRRW